VIRNLRPKHIGTRLILWYVFVLATVLAVTWGFTVFFLFLQLRDQLTHYAVQEIENVEGLLYFDTAGNLELREDYHKHPDSKRLLERLLEVRSPEGGVLYRNERLGRRSLGGNPVLGEGEDQFSPRSTRLDDGTPVRMVSRRWPLNGRPLVIRLAFSEEPILARIRELALASSFVLPIALILVSLGGYVLTQRAVRPLQEMARRADQITSERLNERLPNEEVADELGQLARVFNSLLARLEHSFEQLRRFTSDASHELRTPLASLRSVGEVALQKDGSREEYRDAIGSMLEEVKRLTTLVDSLLTISRADAGCIQLHPTVLQVMDLARQAAGLFEVLVEEKGQNITIDGNERVSVKGDRVFLTQALINIIDNAVKYSPVGGTIHVRVYGEQAGIIRLEVVDSGPGIAPEHADKIFNRFYRVDNSRSRQAGGTGLGLAIAQWAVRVHGGDIQLISAPGSGCTFPPSRSAHSD
jgi:heavy metal sensor kinase